MSLALWIWHVELLSTSTTAPVIPEVPGCLVMEERAYGLQMIEIPMQASVEIVELEYGLELEERSC